MLLKTEIPAFIPQVVGVDFAAKMLDYAKDREQEWQSRSVRSKANIKWLEGDATDLSLPDDSFDAATMGYGLRNVRSVLCSEYTARKANALGYHLCSHACWSKPH